MLSICGMYGDEDVASGKPFTEKAVMAASLARPQAALSGGGK